MDFSKLNNFKHDVECFERYLYENTNGEIVKRYNTDAADYKKEAEKLNSDTQQEFKDLTNNKYGELLDIIRCIENQSYEFSDFFAHSESGYRKEFDSLLHTDDDNDDYYGDSDEQENLKKLINDADVTTSLDRTAKIKLLQERKQCFIDAKKKKFLVLIWVLFGLAILFSIIATIASISGLLNFFEVLSNVCGLCVVAGIVMIVLRVKYPEISKFVKQIEREINEQKELSFKEKVAEIEKRLDSLDNDKAELMKRYESSFDELERKLKERGDLAEQELAKVKKEIFSNVADSSQRIFDRVGALPVKYQKEFISNCMVIDLVSPSDLLGQCEKVEAEYKQDCLVEHQKAAVEEQNRILQQQANEARRAAEEQTRILEKQADETRRAAEEQKRLQQNAASWARTNCGTCKNYSSCMQKFHLDGPCGAYVAK